MSTVFINELHYDNTGGDVGEAIEIAGPAGTDLTGWTLVLYNGTSAPTAATVYSTVTLSGTIDNEGSGYGAVSFAYAANGIQNGAFDGIALVNASGVVVQFISYEGAITAAAGTPAAGLTSTDIGVSQGGTGAIGLSLQLTGTGTDSSAFTWQPETGNTSSFGTLNTGQTMGAAPTNGAFSINDVSASEGNSGTTNFTFTVDRASGSTGAVTLDWALANGTTSAADFTGTTSGTLSFADGETSKTITIGVAGDTDFESNETFAVNLSNATGGATITDGAGAGTITNDDAAPSNGTLSIDDVSIAEGNSGTTNITFTVSRTSGTAGAISADWAFSHGTTDAADFSGGTPSGGTVSFADGETSKTITLTLAGDTAFESNETFSLTLSNATGGAIIGDASGAGTITNDDASPIANVWINEIHYDNASTDSGEAIEIAGVAGADLTGYKIVFYNGSNTPTAAPTYNITGGSGGQLILSGVIDDEGAGYGAVSFVTTGLQNGAADGFALVAPDGTVIQLLSYEGSFTAAAGTAAAGMVSQDIGVSQAGTGAAGLSLQLTGNGASYADYTWQSETTASFGSLNTGQTLIGPLETGLVRVADASVTEGNSGTTSLTFTVYRAGGLGQTASVDWAVSLSGTADAADLDGSAVLSGTVSFAIGESSKTVTLPVLGDTTGEGNETLSIALSNPVGNISITDASGAGTIVNDDPIALTIMQIQGAAHQSAYTGQPVTTTGVVTAVDTNGFYMQDAAGDGDDATSDGIFVFTSTAPTVVAGNTVSVSGTVAEFVGGAGALSLTQITVPVVTVTGSSALPAATLIGTGGRVAPNTLIDNDNFTSFDPATDGIDFWESMEGMRVTIATPQVVSNTTTLGETDVVASLGAGATGMNAAGGITIASGDYNPEKIQIDDDSGVFAGFVPAYSIGDQLSNVTGVLNYSFNNYEVVVTEAVTLTSDVTLARETTALVDDANFLSLATYNLENIDPGDAKYTLIASDIVLNLGAPDILAVQEIQDPDGAGTGADLSGTVTAQGLIDAIFAISGKTYAYVEIAPTTANSTGGEPNGNIRNGYFYDTSRVSYITGSAELITGTAYTGSRNPLVAGWTFAGKTLYTIDVHLTSRGGSDPLWGDTQPPAAAGDSQRTAQAAGVKAWINDHLATDPGLNIAVLGDWNGFADEAAQTQLTDPLQGGVMTDLATLLPSEERYSYMFEGNAQQLDHILVTGGLLTNAQYDAVHLNAQFGGTRGTDHDAQLSLLMLGAAPTGLALSASSVSENLAAGAAVGTASATDTVNDTLTYSLTDTAGGLFAIDGTTGAITTTASLDYEAAASYSVTVRATDTGGLFTEQAFTIAVGDVVEHVLVTGGTGNDTLTSGSGNDTLSGAAGNDSIDAGSGNDFVYGGAGNDTLLGNAGVDMLYGDAGDDALNGGDGFDTANYLNNPGPYLVTYGASAGSGTIAGATFTDSFENIEHVVGSGLDDTFVGGDFAMVVTGAGGNDSILGSLEDDIFYVGVMDGSDTINGSGGSDTIRARTANTSIQMANTIKIEVFDGAGLANFRLRGTALADTYDFTGKTLIDVERVDGGDGDDTITGSTGNDRLAGGRGVDSLDGGDGDDTFLFASGDGFDYIQGGAGTDGIYATTNGVSVDWTRVSGVEIVDGGSSTNFKVVGTAAGDILDFTGVALKVVAQIDGGAGNDTVTGSADNNAIFGSLGADVLTGGAGSDTFVYTGHPQSTALSMDRITDWASGDLIDLAGIDANTKIAANQAFTFIGAGAFTNVAGQLRVFDDGTNTFIQGDVNGDGVADLVIRLDGVHSLGAADFAL